jgi:hypothetical protein
LPVVGHPGLLNERIFVHHTDLYLIEAQELSEGLPRTPKPIFEIN